MFFFRVFKTRTGLSKITHDCIYIETNKLYENVFSPMKYSKQNEIIPTYGEFKFEDDTNNNYLI